MYIERTYRNLMKSKGLVYFNTKVKETDLYIGAQSNLKEEATNLVKKYRREIEDFIKAFPEFKKSLVPLDIGLENCPPIVEEMLKASSMVGVGPMAAVAGGIAEMVGKSLIKYSPEIIVENGGDVFINSRTSKKIGVFAGRSPFSGKLALQVEPEEMPLGVCTSSGTIGPSLSFGKADAVVVVSKNTFLADAAATALGNMVKRPEDVASVLEWGIKIPGIQGIVVIIRDRLGIAGDLKIVK